MNQGSRALQVIVWGLLAIVLLAVVVVFLNASAKRSSLPKYGEVKDFSLTNQLGQTVTLSDLPAVNACLNSASTVLLILGYIFIKRGRQDAHRN